MWDPQLFRGKIEYFRLTVETPIRPEFGRFLQVYFMHRKHVDDGIIRSLVRITKKLEKRNRDHGIVADVMES